MQAPLTEDSIPMALECEQGVLGAILFDNAAFWEIADFDPEHFVDASHRLMARHIAAAIRGGQTIDPLALDYKMASDEVYKVDLGIKYLAFLTSCAPPPGAIGGQYRVLIDRVHRVSAARAVATLSEAIKASDHDINDAIDAAVKALTDGAPQAAKPVRLGDGVGAHFDAIFMGHGAQPISTGWMDLDHRMGGGLYPGGVTVIAGRPGQGKSALALALAKNIAVKGRGVFYVSLEMTTAEMLDRLASDFAYDRHGGKAPYFNMIRRRDLRDDKKLMVADVVDQIEGLPIDMWVTHRATTDKVKSALRQQMSKWEREGIEPGALVIDHIGLMAFDNPRAGRTEGITQITGDLKAMAMELNIPVVILSQLNREAEKRDKDDKRPQLSDLRDSGSIEQDADNVIGLYRPYYYHERKEPLDKTGIEHDDWKREGDRIAGDLYAILLKQRQGKTGTVQLHTSIGHNAIRDFRRVG